MENFATSFYQVSPNAVFESFDDEVVVINMVSGSYFALNDSARTLWTLADQGHSRAALIEAMQGRHEGDPATIAAEVGAFLEDLESEDLLVRTSTAPPHPPTLPEPKEPRSPFVAPVVSKFTDMQDLLLLDPIHEVDEQGWPVAKPAPTP